MTEMLAKKNHERTLRDLLEAVFRHKKKALLFFMIVVVTATGILAVTPGTYTSTSKLMIRRGRESIVLNPVAAPGELQPLYKEWESEINSELEILGSRELVLEVIQSLGSDAFLAPPPSSKSGMLSPVRAVLNPVIRLAGKIRDLLPGKSAEKMEVDAQSQIDKAIQIIEKNLMIEARKKSDIINVSYTAASPELARQVVTRLVDLYLDRRIDVHKVPGAHRFFDQQAEQLLSELKAAEEAIHAMRDKTGSSSLEDNRRVVETIRTQQLQNASALAVSDARVQALRTMLSQQAPADSAAKGGALLDRTEFLALQTMLRQEEITQSSLRAGARELDQQLNQLRSDLAEMNKLDAPLRRLQREQELLEEKHRKYAENKEEARINSELETQKISNVSIVQHATFPERANPSGKLFKLLAAVFLGMIGGVAITLGANALDPTLHSASDISDRLHLPVLLELPVVRKKELNSSIGTPVRVRHPETIFMRSGRDFDKEVESYFQELLFKILALRGPGESGSFEIGVTSSLSGEGVSIVAANLAAAFARDDRFANTLLLDAGMNNPAGNLEEQMASAPFTYQPIHSAPDGEDSGDKPNTAALFADYLARGKKQNYDVIVVDLPPVSQRGTTIRMAAALDLVILVIDAGRIPWRTALWASGLLTDANAELCGTILNRKCFTMPKWLYRKL
jgi:uncharacterized protein involved in exopolysaccharide biosynthesis